MTALEDLGNGIALEMVRITGGTFVMGSPKGQGYDDEHPMHTVMVASFLMGKHLVTQAQWKAVMGMLPPCRFKGARRPVENVSWNDARAFCERLSTKTGRSYRLPGEAQWEYACRAGASTPFSFGETITTELANYNGEFTYLSGPKGLYRHETTDVGSFPPNAFGLFDMHGNVWEWCADAWHDSYDSAPADDHVWTSGRESSHRVVRGGSWHDTPDVCRSAARLKCVAGEGDEFTGFRVVMADESRRVE